MAFSRAFQKCMFYNITGFCKKNHFLQIYNFFADIKSRAQELLDDVSFVIFGYKHGIYTGGGGQLNPPPAYPGFQVPLAGIGLTLWQMNN